jgi:hypothetical protein
MPIPQVNERIKEAPAVMLRAVFAGVGQLLLAADKVRARAAGTGWPYGRTAGKGQGRAQSRWHTLNDTRSATVPLARERANSYHHSAQRPWAPSPDRATGGPAPAAPAQERPAPATPAADKPAAPMTPTKRPATQAKAATQAAASAKPTTQAKTAKQPTAPAKPAGRSTARVKSPAAAPLPGYDDLSLPSLRARMRALDAPTLQSLLAYEKAHARRDDVIAMFERRLAKITAE